MSSVSRETAASLSGLTVHQIRHLVARGSIPRTLGRVQVDVGPDGKRISRVVEGASGDPLVGQRGQAKAKTKPGQWSTATLWSPADVFRFTLIRQAFNVVDAKTMQDAVAREAWALDTDQLDDLAVLAVFTASTPVVCVRAITTETEHMLRIDGGWMLVLPLQPCWAAMAVCERLGDE